MEIDQVIRIINSNKSNRKDFEMILNCDDETILYFLDEYPLEKLKSNVIVKKLIWNKLETLYSMNKFVNLGNVETILEAALRLFPKKYFTLIGIGNINGFSDLFQITIVDYCITNMKKLKQSDLKEFIRNNNELSSVYARLTMLFMNYLLYKSTKSLVQIQKMDKGNLDDLNLHKRFDWLKKRFL